MKLYGLFFLALNILPVFSNSFNPKLDNTSNIYQDDDDYIIPEYHQLKSKFGFVDFNVLLYSDKFCNTSAVMEANHSFDFSTECTCISSNEYCFRELIKQKYFLDYRWNFTDTTYQNHFMKNISYCIAQHKLGEGFCIPCQDFYIDGTVFLNRKFTG